MSDSALEEMRRMMRGESPAPPVAELIGFRLVDVQPGSATAVLEAEERHTNRAGTVYGGILCDLADAAMGVAFATTLGSGEWFTTLELKINYLKAVRRVRLTAEAHVVKRGRSVGLVECDIRDETEDLVARASSTCLMQRAGGG